MHIPDGYLSPSTCAAMYSISSPFWYVALRRAKRALNTRTVPLLGLFAAFCFVIMMFNLPLPGGTTGHAVGMGMASIVLGPWVSILAISMALLIQALFFGDGGVTTYGANCFNMAIIGSLVAYVVYRLVARGAEITSRRRVVAAAIAGYSAINIAALCAAIEFGMQPLLFHTAAGTPLYAPYPLSISIPAMMIGHLTFAGLAELVISGGVVSYLQHADPQMLRLSAPDARIAAGHARPAEWGFHPEPRKLWLALALALILTPLGILAVGSAWGEWSPKDFSEASVRQQIAAASRNHAPPAVVPSGLKRLSSLWKPPVPAYAPAFIRSPYFGYFLSGATGVGLIILLTLLLNWLLSARLRSNVHKKRRTTRGFVERTAASLIDVAQQTVFAKDFAASPGLLQRSDARAKLAGIAALLIAVIAVHRIWAVAVVFALAVLLAALSRISFTLLVKRAWIPVIAFTGFIALPAIFLVAGTEICSVPLLGWPITDQGLRSASFLALRSETSVTLLLLLILSTPWSRLLRALRFFRIPVSVLLMLEMTYRYMFLLLKTSQDMIESRRARTVAPIDAPMQRRVAASMAAVLLDKTLQLSSDVHLAMQARGFRGEVRLMEDLEMKASDWLKLASLVAIAGIATWTGR